MIGLFLLLEAIKPVGFKKVPKSRAPMSRRVSTANWEKSSMKPRKSRLIPKGHPLLTGRALTRQSERTREVWDKDYLAKRFYNKTYTRI